VSGGGTHFRVWAPRRRHVEVVIDGRGSALREEEDGYFAGHVARAEAGTLYQYRLDGDAALLPDPASRWQPSGPHGPSGVVDPSTYRWADGGWRGAVAPPVLYEMHVGTFTPAGTWAGAREKLPMLADLGVTVLELMPVADFPGGFGWGYDGVLLFAPYHGYGEPDDFRRFVDAAHGLGLAVILDVVYNHLGPDGNYLEAFSDQYRSASHMTDWGAGINFDGPGSGPVREFCLANVRHWTQEYHLDGFRFDATQDLLDDSAEHIVKALAREARTAAEGRRLLLVAENEPQEARIVRPVADGGYGLDLIGNDDFHHSACVALTGLREAYYSPYKGDPQEFVSAAKHGFLYQGQWYAWQKQRRGTSTRGLPKSALLHYLENHDQVANGPHGRRLHQVAQPGRWRALVALHLLGPQTPLLFQGQEFASSAPFHYFADHPAELAARVREGRAEFMAQFRNMATKDMLQQAMDPADPETFQGCKLDWQERDMNGAALALHRDLLRLRSQDTTFGATDPDLDGATLGPESFVLRWWGVGPRGDRLLVVNLGADLHLSPAPEPLLAPPGGCGWALLWSSESPRYGGRGTPPVETDTWNLPGASALVLAPIPIEDADDER